jgi:branched-chain amino acid aminotransferase
MSTPVDGERVPPPTSLEGLPQLAAKSEFGEFGSVFSEHMALASYTSARGWDDLRIQPYGAFTMSPAALVLHYGQTIFEGLKAYRMPDGGAALFRPDANARRFRHSANRLAMEPLPEALFLQSVREIARLDRAWIPDAEGAALYLRPFQIADEAALLIRPSTSYLYCLVASPVASYFQGSPSALTLWATRDYSRAAPGGTGNAKCGGNYAASLAAQAEARRQGCDQVVFLDSVERRWIEELGGMNVFFVFRDGSLQTPPLGSTILAGITRDSLIILARDLGMDVREEPYSLEEWEKDSDSGRLTESFACGTAAVVTPIGEVRGRDLSFTIGGGRPGPITERLRSALVAIQRGAAPDPYGWRDRLF